MPSGALDGPIRTVLSESGPTAVAQCLSQCTASPCPRPSFVLRHSIQGPPPCVSTPCCHQPAHNPPTPLNDPLQSPHLLQLFHTAFCKGLVVRARAPACLATIGRAHDARLSTTSALSLSRPKYCPC